MFGDRLCAAPESHLCRKACPAEKHRENADITVVRVRLSVPYPIKYIENNLVWNIEGECFAYYELIPFNYSFLSLEQKDAVHDAFRQLIAQNRDGKIHALQISTESSIRAAQERSKKSVTGRLKEIACAEIDEQTENLVASLLVISQVDYRFFLGFKAGRDG